MMSFSTLSFSVFSKDTFFGSDRSPRLNVKVTYLPRKHEQCDDSGYDDNATYNTEDEEKPRSVETMRLFIHNSGTCIHKKNSETCLA